MNRTSNGLNPVALLEARGAARNKVLRDMQAGKEPESGDTVGNMLKWLALEAAGAGFDEGVRYMESLSPAALPKPVISIGIVSDRNLTALAASSILLHHDPPPLISNE